jgi:hypothetical protein
VSDMHDALNELARRGEPRGFDHVLAGAVDSAAAEVAAPNFVAHGAGGDDLETIAFVMPEPVIRRRRPLGSAIAAAGIAALLLVGAFAVSAVVGGSGGGAGSPEGAVRRLADAVSHEDPLSAADVLAPDEVRSLHGTLDAATQKAKDLQLVQTASAPLAGVDLNVSGLDLSTESLGDGFAKVVVNGGTFYASTHKAQFSPLMQKVLRESHDNSVQHDLADLAQSQNLPTFVVAVRESGRWYVSAAYTALEYIRESNHLPGADFGSGTRSISTLGADSPDAAVQESVRALGSSDWSKLMTMVPPSEIPVYDYRAALTALAQQDARPDGTQSFTVGSMSTSSKVDGNTAKVTLKASGTTDSGKWSIDGGCFTPPEVSVSLTCADGANLRLGPTLTGLDQSAQITVIKESGRWFVSPVGTVLDAIDRFISQIDRRSLFTLLGIPNALPPDGVLTLGRPFVLHPSSSLLGVKVLSFHGHEGESLLGLATSSKPPTSQKGTIFDENFSAGARVFASDGTELDNDGGLLQGESLVLPADGTYTFVLQSITLASPDVTVTIWDTADAPPAAKQLGNLGLPSGSCSYGPGGSETCSGATSPTIAIPGAGGSNSSSSGVSLCPPPAIFGPKHELLGPGGKPLLGPDGTPMTLPPGLDPSTIFGCGTKSGAKSSTATTFAVAPSG